MSKLGNEMQQPIVVIYVGVAYPCMEVCWY
jgi:hypothetical protein